MPIYIQKVLRTESGACDHRLKLKLVGLLGACDHRLKLKLVGTFRFTVGGSGGEGNRAGGLSLKITKSLVTSGFI
jgi:hypothetical protein